MAKIESQTQKLVQDKIDQMSNTPFWYLSMTNFNEKILKTKTILKINLSILFTPSAL